MSQLLLMGLLSTKSVAKSTPVLLVLPVLTIWFHIFCKGRFESAFVRFPLQVCPTPIHLQLVNGTVFTTVRFFPFGGENRML